MSAHTPGPWHANTKSVVKRVFAGDNCIAEMRTRNLADARLIAAAPKLLAALQRITEKVARANAIQHSGGEIVPEDWAELYQLQQEARAAIAKATS